MLPQRRLPLLGCLFLVVLLCGAADATGSGDTGQSEIRAGVERHVRHLSEVIGPRNASTPEAYADTAQYIANNLALTGAKVVRRDNPNSLETPPTLEASFDDAPANLILCAHYDSVPRSPGALDNASGVAILLELAKLVRAVPRPPGLRIVLFPNEEMPFFMTPASGSAHYAMRMAARGPHPARVVAVDSIGGSFKDAGLGPISQLTDESLAAGARPQSASLAHDLTAAMRPSLDIRPVVTALGGYWIDRSDHFPFTAQGWQGALLTSSASPLNTRQHTPADTPEGLDFTIMVKTVIGLRDFVIQEAHRQESRTAP